MIWKTQPKHRSHISWRRKRSLSEWADGAVRILATIYRDRDLRADSEADRGIVACVTRLQELNEQLRRIPPSVLPECTASQALQLLLRQIGESFDSAGSQ